MFATLEGKIGEGGSFPGQRDGENIEMYMRKHFIALLVPVLFLILLGTFIGVLFNYWWDHLHTNLSDDANMLFLLLFATGLLFILHTLFIRIINHFLAVVVITDNRIIDMRCTSLLSRERDMVELVRIQDLRVVQVGLFKRLFNFGSIVIHDASGHEIFTFNRIARPHKYFNTINHIYRKALKLQGRMSIW